MNMIEVLKEEINPFLKTQEKHKQKVEENE